MSDITRYHIEQYDYNVHGPADDYFLLSHSIMDAIHMCPKWGLIRYVHKRTFQEAGRSMALQFGSMLHNCFAAMRLWQIAVIQKLPDHAEFHFKRCLGEDRGAELFDSIHIHDTSYNALSALMFRVLATELWEDDPSDKQRTMANAEIDILKYSEEYYPTLEDYPIWIEDYNDPTKMVGVEMPITLIVKQLDNNDNVVGEPILFIGTLDGFSQTLAEELLVEENKTAGRPDAHYRNAFRASSQITGYIASTRAMLGQNNDKVRIRVTKTKMMGRHDDQQMFIETRGDHRVLKWANGLFYARAMIMPWLHDPCNAPEFTHSCNRYFTSCAFIPLCSTEDYSDQVDMFNSMVTGHMSPSEEALMELIKKHEEAA